MANRRFGNNPQQRGGGGNGGGMNRGNFGPPSSNINPWQGGVAPGNSAPNFPTSQLALTLANLIQQSTQQQVPSSDGPPSLLTMNTSPGFFNNQDQYNNQNRFGNRGRPDFRRSEPYNKNRGGGGWRHEGRNNGPARQGNNKNRQNFNNKNSPKRDNKTKNNEKREKREKPADVSNEKSKDKDQKPAEVAAASTTANESVEDDTKREGKTTKFDGLPNCLLHCFVCNKSMWDGESFHNHVGGKAHKQMISSLEESFQITVNILRENMRLCEERKMIEYERMQRSRRYHHNNSNEPESHCNMCDLKFMGKIVVHRQTEGHQRLKRFLHPKCLRCNLEFASRMEWVDHQFVPEHLFRLKFLLEEKNVDFGEYKLKVPVEIDTEPLLDEHIQNEDDNPVLELHDDMTNLFNRIPVFKPNRGVGKSSLKPANGFICDICKLFMPSEEESKKHWKSYTHYLAFVEAAKTKFQNAANDKKKKEESNGEEPTVKESDDDNKDDEAMDKLLDDIYDPHAVDDAEDADESNEEQNAEVKTETTETKEDVAATTVAEETEEAAEESKVEPEAKEEESKDEEAPNTPVTRAKRSNVKNGAGPKSKKLKN